MQLFKLKYWKGVKCDWNANVDEFVDVAFPHVAVHAFYNHNPNKHNILLCWGLIFWQFAVIFITSMCGASHTINYRARLGCKTVVPKRFRETLIHQTVVDWELEAILFLTNRNLRSAQFLKNMNFLPIERDQRDLTGIMTRETKRNQEVTYITFTTFFKVLRWHQYGACIQCCTTRTAT